jgi:hypothetical protein
MTVAPGRLGGDADGLAGRPASGVAERVASLTDAHPTDLAGVLVEAPVGLDVEQDQLPFHVQQYPEGV